MPGIQTKIKFLDEMSLKGLQGVTGGGEDGEEFGAWSKEVSVKGGGAGEGHKEAQRIAHSA